MKGILASSCNLVPVNLLLGILLLAGCASGGSGAAGGRPDSAIPFGRMERYFSSRQWAAVYMNYHAYVIMEGRLELTGKVTVRKFLKSSPDYSQDKLASSLVGKIKIRSINSESRIRPIVRVYVMFHGRGVEFSEPEFAVVYAEQMGFVGQTGEGEDLAIVYL